MPIRRSAFAAAAILTTVANAAGSALHDAVAANDTAAVAELDMSGADLDGKDDSGRTALLVAVGSGADDIALALIAAGANINAQAHNMDTPWLLAGAEGRTGLIAAMIPRKPDLSLRNRFGGNALIPACERGHADTVRLLLTTDIDVDHVNDLGWTCLLEAVILGDGGAAHQEIVRMALAAGADPNLADREGITPLGHAKAKGQAAVAGLIEKAGGR